MHGQRHPVGWNLAPDTELADEGRADEAAGMHDFGRSAELGLREAD